MTDNQFSTDKVALYMVNALMEAAEKTPWPVGARGVACQLLLQDLAEFGATMVAAARAQYWSPAWALERLWIERLEVLMGVIEDGAFAKRYCDSVLKAPDASTPLKPKTKARAEDAVTILGRSTGLSASDLKSFRDALLSLKDSASDWFVHPTALGPSHSRTLRMGGDYPAESWGVIVNLLTFGCLWGVVATNRCGVPTSIELVRAIDGGARVQEQLDSSSAEGLRAIQRYIAGLVEQSSSPTPEAH